MRFIISYKCCSAFMALY